jgi:MarR family transcriptional regulator, lower aerobic nicotinate degradation pathway regulator
VKFPEHAALSAQTGFLLRKVSHASFSAFSKVAARHGLHPMHFGLLMIVEAEEPISQQELGRRIGIDASTMVARMDVLDDAGLVVRTRNSDDRRSYDICLSPKGRKVLGELRVRAKEHADGFFAPLTRSEREQLHALLAKLAASLDETETA